MSERNQDAVQASSKVSTVISVSSIKDIKTWMYASSHIVENIDADAYKVIVPSRYVELFRAVTPSAIDVVDENELAREFDFDYVKARIPEINHWRIGWYYQQLLKIQGLIKFSRTPDDVVLIWDADTVPLRKMSFVQDGKLIYFKGVEYHRPYFETIKRLLGKDKVTNFSFITQSFPIYGKWIFDFVKEVEQTHGVRWFDAILNSTELIQASGFSEYETLGTFISHHYPDAVLLNSGVWERAGNSLGSIENLGAIARAYPGLFYLAFESYVPKSTHLQKKCVFKKPETSRDLLRAYFELNAQRQVILCQVSGGVGESMFKAYLESKEHDAVSLVCVEPFAQRGFAGSLMARPNTILITAAENRASVAGSRAKLNPMEMVESAAGASLGGTRWDEPFSDPAAVQQRPLPLRHIKTCRQAISWLVIGPTPSLREVLLGLDWTCAPDIILIEPQVEDLGMKQFLEAFDFKLLAVDCGLLYINDRTVEILS